MGNDTLTIKMGNQTTKLDLGTSTTEAMQSIKLKVGQSSIKIDQTGVTIKGMMVKVEGQIQTEVKGLMTRSAATRCCTVKGGDHDDQLTHRRAGVRWTTMRDEARSSTADDRRPRSAGGRRRSARGRRAAAPTA